MSNRKVAKSAAARRRWRAPGLGGPALALLALVWTGAPAAVRADTIVLKSGETLEGSIIDATRNTLVVQRAIGGMRQMPLRDIAEVRIELALGQTISGQLLGWAKGVYQLRSGGEIVLVRAGDVVSRTPSEAAAGQPQSSQASRPVGPQTVRRAAAPATSARGQMAAQEPEDEDRSPAAAGQGQGPAARADRAPAAEEDQGSPAVAQRSLAAVDEDQARPAAERRSPSAGKEQNLGTEQRRDSPERKEQGTAAVGEGQAPAAGERPAAAEGQAQSAPAGEGRSLAAVDEDQAPAASAKQNLVVKASVDPAEPGAENMVFRIELSRPAEQTVVLIYGTVEGTAKAGEDFEPQQGMVTLAPGTKSTEVSVPLIEQPASEGEKRFELFLAADPKVAEVVDQRITATINGGD